MPSSRIGTLWLGARELDIYAGDTLAACLLRAGVYELRRSRAGQLRGVYCAIGICNECLVTVNGMPNVRACITLAAPELEIESGTPV